MHDALDIGIFSLARGRFAGLMAERGLLLVATNGLGYERLARFPSYLFFLLLSLGAVSVVGVRFAEPGMFLPEWINLLFVLAPLAAGLVTVLLAYALAKSLILPRERLYFKKLSAKDSVPGDGSMSFVSWFVSWDAVQRVIVKKNGHIAVTTHKETFGGGIVVRSSVTAFSYGGRSDIVQRLLELLDRHAPGKARSA